MARGSRPKPVVVGNVRARVHRGPREDGRWYWRVDRPDGTGGRVTVCPSLWATSDEVQAHVIAVLARDPEAGVRLPDRHIEIRTVYHVMAAWVVRQKERPDIAQATKACYEANANMISGCAAAATQADRVTKRTLERLRDELLEHYSLSTVRGALRTFRQAWADLRDLGWVPQQILPRVRVQGRTPAKYTPTTEELLAVLEQVRRPNKRGGARPAWHWRIVYLYWATGCRRGELAGLTWGDIDLDRRRLHVVGKMGPRVVQLHPAVAREIGTWERGEAAERVWPVADVTIGTSLRDAIHAACDRAKVPRFSVQALRRLAVDTLYGTVGVDEAAALIGHSPTVALRNYRRVREATQQDALLRSGLGVLPGDEDNVIEGRFGGEEG